jgi:hypothetical protein
VQWSRAELVAPQNPRLTWARRPSRTTRAPRVPVAGAAAASAGLNPRSARLHATRVSHLLTKHDERSSVHVPRCACSRAWAMTRRAGAWRCLRLKGRRASARSSSSDSRPTPWSDTHSGLRACCDCSEEGGEGRGHQTLGPMLPGERLRAVWGLCVEAEAPACALGRVWASGRTTGGRLSQKSSVTTTDGAAARRRSESRAVNAQTQATCWRTSSTAIRGPNHRGP